MEVNVPHAVASPKKSTSTTSFKSGSGNANGGGSSSSTSKSLSSPLTKSSIATNGSSPVKKTVVVASSYRIDETSRFEKELMFSSPRYAKLEQTNHVKLQPSPVKTTSSTTTTVTATTTVNIKKHHPPDTSHVSSFASKLAAAAAANTASTIGDHKIESHASLNGRSHDSVVSNKNAIAQSNKVTSVSSSTSSVSISNGNHHSVDNHQKE